MDPGRRRHDEYRAALGKARRATKAEDLLEPYTPRDATLTDIFELIAVETPILVNQYYPGLCMNVDLLFYINLQDVMGLIEAPYPDVTDLANLPWRSISFVMGRRSCVLTARGHAPKFLSAAVGTIKHRDALPQ
jgi:hypothetical protein